MFWIYLGQDLLTVGRAADARRHLARALEERQDEYVMDLIGRSHWMQGEFDDAERCWRKSLEWNDRRAWPWLLLGKLELQRNRPEEAVALLERAIELAPTAYEAAYSLSMAYRRAGRVAEADRLRERSDHLRKTSPPPAGGMGTMPSPKS